MNKVIDHTHRAYKQKWQSAGGNRFNGAFYYSREIVKNIIPNVDTERPWVTVNIRPHCEDHAIVFIHNNKRTDRYEWLKDYSDLILVCGIPETCDKVSHLGKAVYLPLSIDVDYVSQFRLPDDKRSGIAYVGRRAKRRWKDVHVPEGVDVIENLDRPILLRKMARYESVYAVGRAAIEAKVLGCKVLAYDERYPDPSIWRIVDNAEAAKMLQQILDEIDGRGKGEKNT